MNVTTLQVSAKELRGEIPEDSTEAREVEPSIC